MPQGNGNIFTHQNLEIFISLQKHCLFFAGNIGTKDDGKTSGTMVSLLITVPIFGLLEQNHRFSREHLWYDSSAEFISGLPGSSHSCFTSLFVTFWFISFFYFYSIYEERSQKISLWTELKQQSETKYPQSAIIQLKEWMNHCVYRAPTAGLQQRLLWITTVNKISPLLCHFTWTHLHRERIKEDKDCFSCKNSKHHTLSQLTLITAKVIKNRVNMHEIMVCAVKSLHQNISWRTIKLQLEVLSLAFNREGFFF